LARRGEAPQAPQGAARPGAAGHRRQGNSSPSFTITMNKVYRYKSGRSLPIDPQVAGEAIEALGTPTASEILEAATPADAPLHPAFEWDDSEAAHQYRLNQAREIPRCLQVEITPAAGAGEVRVMPAFVNLPPAGGSRSEGVYVDPLTLSETEMDRARMVILRQINGLQSTLQALEAATATHSQQEVIRQISERLADAKELAGTLS
jgi:hypothetical protein